MDKQELDHLIPLPINKKIYSKFLQKKSNATLSLSTHINSIQTINNKMMTPTTKMNVNSIKIIYIILLNNNALDWKIQN